MFRRNKDKRTRCKVDHIVYESRYGGRSVYAPVVKRFWGWYAVYLDGERLMFDTIVDVENWAEENNYIPSGVRSRYVEFVTED